MKWMLSVGMCLLLFSCQSGSGGVAEKVMADFGLRDAPEGHVSGGDRVFENLDAVGASEMKRMNAAGRHGEIEFEGDGRRGHYFKSVKVYESSRPFDVGAITGSSDRARGFNGFIEYRYRVFESERKSTSTEAAAETASIATSEEGREVYRYNFSIGGVWDGGRGERTRR